MTGFEPVRVSPAGLKSASLTTRTHEISYFYYVSVMHLIIVLGEFENFKCLPFNFVFQYFEGCSLFDNFFYHVQ
jgi:hypothetical protein